MNLILSDKAQIARAVNATVLPLVDAPLGYREFDQGAAKKYVLDPHEMIAS
jgi:glutathione-independent formaldehyde dehydrogenase